MKIYHIDMSGRFYEKKTCGIACVNSLKTNHNGCALTHKLKRYIEKNLCIGEIKEDKARLYAICIYFLIKDKLEDIDTLIICNDESFIYVKEYLHFLLEDPSNKIKIKSITEFQKKLGKKVKSIADNFANAYRKRALKPTKRNIGIKLKVVEINYNIVKDKWLYLDKIK